jgi:predicted permease
VALVVVLLTGAGLLIRSFLQLQQVDLGFRPDHLLTVRMALGGAKYPPPQRLVFYDALAQRLAAIPGVQGVGATSSIFLSNTPNSTTFTIEGRPRTRDIENTEVPLDAVTPDYFRTMGIALVRGRTFTAEDGRDSTPPVAIINEAMAKRFWPNENPVGRRFKYGEETSQSPWLTIVGVVGDMRRTGLDRPVRYETFLPLRWRPYSQMTFVLRTSREPLSFAPALRAAVRAVDPALPVYEVKSMDELLSDRVAQRRFSMALLGTFAALALVLGLVGVYGVTSYLVAQRTREVGLRLALGAQPRTVVRMVVRQGMVVAAVGVGAGLVGALALTRLMAGLLYEVSPNDAATLGVVTAVLAGATLLANYIPARRAARVDPLVALRAE